MKNIIIVHPIEITAENLLERFGKTAHQVICHIEEGEDECIFLELKDGKITGVNFMFGSDMIAVKEYIETYDGFCPHVTEIFKRLVAQYGDNLSLRKQLIKAIDLYTYAFITQPLNQ